MAFSSNKHRKRTQRSLMSDMNVTPMIDVMLVLLVIFMITAPLLTVGVKVDLPSANAPSINDNETPIVVYVNKEGRIFIGEVEVDAETLPDKLKAITRENTTEAKIFVKGDKTLSYGTIMDVMGRVSSSGFKKVVLVTELPKK
ncbi:MAG: protein TolR [Holosporaceae bacterium]|jgi:biopolymer transport protein TolR|nr:protein TolR [Holosporaceae bacterium]